MSEKYAEKGLTVLAIAKQPKADVEKFVEELEAKHPVVCESGDSMRAYGCNSYPSCFLVGSNGRILWTGHPGDFKDDLVESTLAKTKLLPTLTKTLSVHAKSIERLKYGAVLTKVEADLKAARFVAEEDKTAATALQEWLSWYGTSAIEGAADLVGKGDPYRAYVTLSDTEELFKGHALSAQAKAAMGKLKADSAHALEIKAGQMLEELKKELGDERDREKIGETLKPLLGKKYAETKAGREAADLAAGRDPSKAKAKDEEKPEEPAKDAEGGAPPSEDEAT
jgi:hypothetical protein